MISLKRFVAPALAGFFAIAAPMSANALTIGIHDVATGTTLYVADGGAEDTAGAVGVITVSGLTVGGTTVTAELALIQDLEGFSRLTYNADVTTTAGTAWVDVSHIGFTGGSNGVDASTVAFNIDPSYLSGSGYAVGGYVDDANGGGMFLDYAGVNVASGPLNSINDEITGQTSLVLDDPFSMSIKTNVYAGSTISFDATIVAAIPLPAAGLMLLTALGGLGIVRRRRKAA